MEWFYDCSESEGSTSSDSSDVNSQAMYTMLPAASSARIIDAIGRMLRIA